MKRILCDLKLFRFSFLADFTELCYDSSEEKTFDTDGEYEIL